MQSRKIMIIDDDIEFRDSIHMILMDMDHDVLPMPNGAQAVTSYADFRPDIVFLDMRMPLIDGYDVFFQLTAKDPDARIVFMSSYDLNEEKYKRVTDVAPVGVLEKPLRISDIKRMIKTHSKQITAGRASPSDL